MDFQLSLEDVARELGAKDVLILQLQSQLKSLGQVLQIPGVQEAIAKHQAASAVTATGPLPEGNGIAPPFAGPVETTVESSKPTPRPVKDAPQA